MRVLNLLVGLVVLALLAASPGLAAPPTDAQNCEAAIEMASAKYSLCRLTAESKFSKTSDGAKLSAAKAKCTDKLSTAFSRAVNRFGAGDCNSLGASEFDAYLAQCSDDVAAAAGIGGTLPNYSGDLATCNDDLSTCTGALSSSQASLSTCNTTLTSTETNLATCSSNLSSTQAILTSCNEDLTASQASLSICNTTLSSTQASLTSTHASLTTCTGDLSTCNTGLASTGISLTTCQTDLASCQAAPSGRPVRTGQTTCWDTGGIAIPCAGTGQDSDLNVGLAFAFRDNGDRTITDLNTGLMWQKLSYFEARNGGLWTDAFAKVSVLNAQEFAGYRDWRLPNIRELLTLVDYRLLPWEGSLVAPAFDTGCDGTCVDSHECSCTGADDPNPYVPFWSSTSAENANGYVVEFNVGRSTQWPKNFGAGVRAVRGGL